MESSRAILLLAVVCSVATVVCGRTASVGANSGNSNHGPEDDHAFGLRHLKSDDPASPVEPVSPGGASGKAPSDENTASSPQLDKATLDKVKDHFNLMAKLV